MDNITDAFIDYIWKIDRPFPEKTVIQVKRCLLDYLGVTFSGAKLISSKTRNILNYASNSDLGIIGMNRKTDLFTSVLINGLNSHVIELDDGNRHGAVHPGAPIFSALLPLANKENINVDTFIKSVIIAYETAILISKSIQPSHYRLGYHPTATCGSIATAIGVASLLSFSKQKTKDAFSAAAISASGSLKVIEDGSELKPFNVGRSALVGVLSAIMSDSCFTGPNDVLEGETGFFNIMSNSTTLNIPTSETEYLINDIYFKPYASCRHAHPAIEATMHLRNEVDLNKIKSIKLRTYNGVVGKHDYKKVSNILSAKMSIPFSIALVLKYGTAGIESFTEDKLEDKTIINLMDKIEIIPDEEISKLIPQKRAAILDIITIDDHCISKRVDYPKGEPENPMTNNEIQDKFLTLSKFAGKTEEESFLIMDKVWNIENNFNELLKLINQ